jgi:hypothetical protein
MGITDLSTFTSKHGVTTAVWLYDEADTYVVQHDFLHMSFFKDDFKEFVDTLVVALRQIEKADSPMKHIHPIVLHEVPAHLTDAPRLDDLDTEGHHS